MAWLMGFSQRERDHILAGLRLLQESVVPLSIQEIATEHGGIMSNEEIDDLCERINE